MEKIEPLADHVWLSQFELGQRVWFRGEAYTILSRTTLASGEPALVLQNGRQQFVVGAAEFLADLGEER